MGRRTTSRLVKQILDADFDSSVNLEAFIDTASVLVDKIEASPVVGTVTEQHLELIERWLTAHYVELIYRTTKTSESIGAASRSWQTPQVSRGVEGTIYGQQAMNLDTTGTLKSITGDPVRCVWLGTEE